MLAINELHEFVEVDEPRFITLSPVNIRSVIAQFRKEEIDSKKPNTCKFCGKPIEHRKKGAKYCGSNCKSKDFIRRRRMREKVDA